MLKTINLTTSIAQFGLDQYIYYGLTSGLNRSLRSLGRAKARPLTKRYVPSQINEKP
jgi:hypothetical protein